MFVTKCAGKVQTLFVVGYNEFVKQSKPSVLKIFSVCKKNDSVSPHDEDMCGNWSESTIDLDDDEFFVPIEDKTWTRF